jgi:hypothetical protein
VPAGRDPLRDDHIAARLGSGHRFVVRADLPADQGATLVDPLHQAAIRPAVEELDHAGRACRQLEAAGLDFGQCFRRDDEVDAERSCRERLQTVQLHLEPADRSAT